MNHNEPTLNQTQITSNTGSKASVSNSMPPLAPAKKQGSTVLIILMVLFFLFILFVGGGYAAWVFVVKPKLNSSLALDDKMNKANQQIQSIQKSAEDLIKKTQDPQQQALQDQINAAQQAAQNALNNPELQKQIQDAQNAANQLLNQANQQLNNTIANAPLANAPTAAPSAQIPTQQNLTNNTTPPDATAPATVTASPDAATNPNTAQQVQSLPSAVPAQTPSNATPTNNASATANNQAQVLISSNPQGAKISINDVANGLSTPASLSNLLLNTQYKIKLEKAGYYTLEGFFTPTTSTLQEFNFPMKELPAAPKKVKSKAPREDGDFRLKQRPPPGVGGYNNNSFRSGGYGY